MGDILDYLNELTQPDGSTPEYRELLKQLEPFDEAFKKQVSITELNRFWGIQDCLIGLECREAFARGFRLGAGVLLAVLTPPGRLPGPPDTRHRSSAGR